MDATAHGSLAGTYGVKGYPTIKVFPAGKKGKAVDYNGPREAGGIVEYANRLLEESNVPPPITQITSQVSESAGIVLISSAFVIYYCLFDNIFGTLGRLE